MFNIEKEACWLPGIFFSGAVKGLAVFISGSENRDCWCGFSGAKIRGVVVCFSGTENRGSLA